MSRDAATALLAQAGSVTLTAHLNPDGDGIGAALALAAALAGRGVATRVVLPSPLPPIYRFLPGAADIACIDDPVQAAQEPPVDVLVACDSGDLARLGACAALPRRALLNLDHHASNARFGDVDLVEVAAESTGVVAAGLIASLGVALTRDLATCLYTTVVYDTGRFMHSNTTAHTHRFVADLLETGIDAAAINRALTYTRTPQDLEILRLALGRLVVDEDEPRLAGIALPASDVASLGEVLDWGDVVDLPRSLQGVEIAYFLRSSADGARTKVSLRSNPPWRVGPVAGDLGGGGHHQAAGATVEGPLDTVLADLLPRLRGVFSAG